jgi:flagellar hook protein FlgE
MSINGAMLAGVSGLSANAAALSTISQNIANVNTVGYKRASTEFSTVVNSQQQGTSFSAGGVKAASRHFISQTGLLQRTTSNTDLAIAGQGFFVVTEKSEDLNNTDARLFTRAGAFAVDKLGYLQNTAGHYLQGWPVSDNGEIDSDPSDMTRLRTINVGTVGGAAEPTSRVGLNANLKSSQVAPTEVTAGTYPPLDFDADADNSMAAYLADSKDSTISENARRGIEPQFQITVPVSDSKGGQQNLVLALVKADAPNTWHAELIAPPVIGPDGTPRAIVDGADSGRLKQGTIVFTPDGRLDTDLSTILTDGLLVLEMGKSDAAGTDARWAEHLGANTQQITFDLNASAGGLTQYESPSVVQATFTNGTTFGNLTEVKIDDRGFVTAVFDNGVMRKIAQVALATFPSTDNLTEVSGNAFRVSQDSGTFNLKAPGSGGAGLLAASQLEASTVDLSTEFTGLITTQRAYSASSKIITTADEMLAELINIKR